MSSVANCSRITNALWKWGLLRAEFEPEKIYADKDMLYRENSVEVLQRQRQISNVDKEVYFRQRGTKNRERSMHHSMKSKEFFDIYDV